MEVQAILSSIRTVFPCFLLVVLYLGCVFLIEGMGSVSKLSRNGCFVCDFLVGFVCPWGGILGECTEYCFIVLGDLSIGDYTLNIMFRNFCQKGLERMPANSCGICI